MQLFSVERMLWFAETHGHIITPWKRLVLQGRAGVDADHFLRGLLWYDSLGFGPMSRWQGDA